MFSYVSDLKLTLKSHTFFVCLGGPREWRSEGNSEEVGSPASVEMPGIKPRSPGLIANAFATCAGSIFLTSLFSFISNNN